MVDFLKLALLISILAGCKSAQKCDAYSINDYDYIQVLGYTDTIPTLGAEQLHLPPGQKYKVKCWKNDAVTIVTLKP